MVNENSKRLDVFIPSEAEEALDEVKNANGFAELVQHLNDRSLSLIIREAKDDGKKASKVLREYYQGIGKPRIISLYTELTSLKKGENETTTDYMIRAETAATALKSAEEVISDGLLIAMHGFEGTTDKLQNVRNRGDVVIQREKPMTFCEFKIQLRNYEENEKSCHPTDDKDNVMFVKPQMKPRRFEGKCYKCDKKGHKISECWIKSEKWCVKCKSKTHNTKDCRCGRTDSAKTATEPKKEENKEDNDEHSFTFTLQDLEDGSRRRPQNPNLLVDTGATSHIINDSSKFVSFYTV